MMDKANEHTHASIRFSSHTPLTTISIRFLLPHASLLFFHLCKMCVYSVQILKITPLVYFKRQLFSRHRQAGRGRRENSKEIPG